METFKVAALIGGEPGPLELWTLRSMASAPCELLAVQTAGRAAAPRLARAKLLLGRYGPLNALSRLIGAEIGMRVAARDRRTLEALFDYDDLRAWWERSGVLRAKTRSLNQPQTRAALSAFSPDVIVRVSGGFPKPRVASLSRLATLNIRLGQAPLIGGMWSIARGLVAGRRDWIGATVHVIDPGGSEGAILWRGGPQLAPGDANADLLFRAHLEAARALTGLLTAYAKGEAPRPWVSPPEEASPESPASCLREWFLFLRSRQGRRSRVLIERGFEC